MYEDSEAGDALVAPRPQPPERRGHPGLVLTAALLTAAISAAVCVAAVLTPAPVAAVAFVVAICVGGPIFATWGLPPAIASLRAERANRLRSRALIKLRRALERLPETEHPLGF